MRGMARFQEHFKDAVDDFVVIGGAACELLFEESSLEFRLTKDIDIVVIAEPRASREFGDALWGFIKKGAYQSVEKGVDNPRLFRIKGPKNPEYPMMVELLSKKPDSIVLREGQVCVPLSFEDEISSLSAIALDDEYYRLITSAREIQQGVPVLKAPGLIAFKAKAWLNLTREKNNGIRVQKGTIRKHFQDVFRLTQILSEADKLTVSPIVFQDIQLFCRFAKESNYYPRKIGLSVSREEALNRVISAFVVEE